MKFYQMRKVLKNDWKKILTNPIALLVIGGIAIIPGLYAWVNIIACWDVYENTGDIPVAIVNNDRPAEFRDKEIAIGDSIVEQLKENDKMDWKFVSQKQADLGLADGTYYAAIELPEDFSYNFTTMFSETPTRPKIIFKVDNKINPVAGKITESAKNALVQEIESSFIATVNQSIFSLLNPVGEDAEANLESIIKMKDALVNLNQNMDFIFTNLENLHTNSVNLNQFLTSIKATWPLVQNGLDILGTTSVNQLELSRSTQQRLDDSLAYLDTNLAYIQTSGERTHALLGELNEAAKEGSTAKLDSVFWNLDATLSSMSSAVDATATYLDEYRKIDWGQDIDYALNLLKPMQSTLNDIVNKSGDNSDGDNGDNANSESQDTSNIESLNNVLSPSEIQAAINALDAVDSNLTSDGDGEGGSQEQDDGQNNPLDDLKGRLEDVKIPETPATAFYKYIEQTLLPAVNDAVDFLEDLKKTSKDKSDQYIPMIASLRAISAEVDDMRTKLSEIHEQSDAAVQISAGIADTINNDLYQTESQLTTILMDYHQNIRGDVSTIGKRLVTSADDSVALVLSAQKLGSEIGNMLDTSQSGVALTAEFTSSLRSKLKEFETTIKVLGGKLELANNTDLVQIISILQSNPEFMGDFISNPFDQQVESIYAIPNYGSSMAPTYTALALWVGCLFMNSVLKSRPTFEGAEHMTVHEQHYGKMLTFCSIALAQGLIVSLGDILILKIYTVNAGLFVLFSVFSSLVFCITTFTLYSCFGNAGKVLAIIYMIFQIPSSGGTYPIQVNPPIFRFLQPLFPFTYTVSGFREAIAGPSTSQVLLDFAALGVLALVFLIAGYFILEKTEKSVRRFAETFKSSGLS